MDLAMAQRLVDRRKAAGLSQETLAAQLDVSRQAVSQSSLNASIQQPPLHGFSICGFAWDSPILHGSSSSRFPS